MLMPDFEFEKQAAIRDFIIASGNTSHDLSDLLIAHSANESGCLSTLTFDKNSVCLKD